MTDVSEADGSVDAAAFRIAAMLGDEPAEREEEGPEVEAEEEETEEAEDDSDDTEAQDDDQAEDEADEEPEEKPAPSVHKVKVNGEERDVTLEDLIAGYQKGDDYSRKTAEVAEERKAARAEIERTRTERKQFSDAMGVVIDMLKQGAPQLPTAEDWEQSPGQAYRMQQAVEAHRARIAQAVNMKTAADQRLKEEQSKTARQRLDEGRAKLPELIPEWKDTAKAKAESRALAEYLTTKAGMTATDVDNLTDPRAIALIRKAWLYDGLQESKPSVQKRVAKAPPMAKPGSSAQKRGPGEKLKAARTQLRKTGSVRDAAAAFEQLLD